jgi:23S rRNA pseudouridine1911/1915/1917 synthase
VTTAEEIFPDIEHISPGVDGAVFLVPFVVETNYAGWRLDKYLCEKIRRLSRTRVQQIIETDLVCERKLKASTLVWPGLSFSLRRKVQAEPTVPKPEAIAVLYQDDALFIVDKPAGLPIHPTARYHHGTLVSQLKVRFGADFVAHPAHRLDRETSGIVVCARTTDASRALNDAFQQGRIEKEYLAIVEGTTPEHYTVDAPIVEGTELIRIAVRIDRELGKPALTAFQTLKHFTHQGLPHSLVCCRPKTGRQHQIRVHSQHASFPLVGDKMYGADPGYFDRFSKGVLETAAWARLKLPRHALHASSIRFQHPTQKRTVEFAAPLPSDLQAFIDPEHLARTPRSARK